MKDGFNVALEDLVEFRSMVFDVVKLERILGRGDGREM